MIVLVPNTQYYRIVSNIISTGSDIQTGASVYITHTQPIKCLRAYRSFYVLQECVYTVIECFTLTSQLCTHLNKQRYCHFGVYKCMHTAGRSTMHGMSWSGFVTGAVDACMMSLLLRAWWAARPEATSVGTPLGQDGRPSTCAISGPRRPPGTFDTPNRIVSSVSVGWWRSRGEV